jgi:hypothetical protein
VFVVIPIVMPRVSKGTREGALTIAAKSVESVPAMNRTKATILVCTILGSFALGQLSAQVRLGNMKDALDELKSARTALERATPGKGGHREKAIEYVDLAIDQVKKGIKFSNSN